jgi:hypothetical protein
MIQIALLLRPLSHRLRNGQPRFELKTQLLVSMIASIAALLHEDGEGLDLALLSIQRELR